MCRLHDVCIFMHSSVCVCVCVSVRVLGGLSVFTVHDPDCLMEKLVLEPGGPGFEAAKSLSRRQQLKRSMLGVVGVS